MKQYGLYDVKDYEQCVYIGTIKEISNYLGYNAEGIRSYLTRKKKRKTGIATTQIRTSRNT